MPLGELAGEAVGGLFRFVAWLAWDLLVEGVLYGTGRFVLRRFGYAEPGDAACLLVGLLTWAALVIGLLVLLA